MKFIAKTSIVSGKGTVPSGADFDPADHEISDDEVEVLIARGFVVPIIAYPVDGDGDPGDDDHGDGDPAKVPKSKGKAKQ